MSIIDPPRRPELGASQGELKIRRVVSSIVNQMEQSLAQVKAEIKTYTRASIRTKLGVGDDTELTKIYNLIKTALESDPLNKTIPDLPS